MTIKIWAASKQGPRDENQDCILTNGWMSAGDAEYFQEIDQADLDKPLLVAIFDGMGGYTGGAFASHTAAFTMSLSQPQNELEIQKAVDKTNRELLNFTASNPKYAQMGCTFTGVLVTETSFTIAHVGDSPAYRFMHGVLAPLIELDRVPSPRNPSRYVLTQAIGRENIACRPETFPINSPLTLLLCSDGVTDVLSDEQLSKLLPATDPAHEIVSTALTSGTSDNTTAVVIEISPRERN